MTYVKGRHGNPSRLKCDGWQCTSFLLGRNAVLLRAFARDIGWRKLGGPGGVGDRCTSCRPISLRR